MEVGEAFDRGVADYDRARRQLIPCFDEFYRTAVALLPFPTGARIRVLDLGAGTGLLASLVAETFGAAALTLMDVAPAMLEAARERFARRRPPLAVAPRFVVADYARTPLDGPYDAIVSALSIHHLEDADKRALYGRAYAALAPGGAFVNADQVLGATPGLEAAYRRDWHDRVRQRGATEADLAAAARRMEHDRMTPLAEQLDWLRAAGFADVDCWYKNYSFAVFAGFKR